MKIQQRAAFTLVEVLVALGVFSLVLATAAMSVGAMIKSQRSALLETHSSWFAQMLARWRYVDMATRAYSYYAYSFLPAGVPTSATATYQSTFGSVELATASLRWPNLCDLLTPATIGPSGNARRAPFDADFSYKGGELYDRFANSRGIYVVNLDSSFASGLTASEVRSQTQFESLRDMVLTVGVDPTGPLTTGVRYARVTVWYGATDYLRNSERSSGNPKVPLVFLTRYYIPDYLAP